MNRLYAVVGISKEAVYANFRRCEAFDEKLASLVCEADFLRREHPGCGVEKMYYVLKPDFMGGDKFIDIFMDFGFGLKRKPSRRRTTFAVGRYYPNRIKGMIINAPNRIWQSDITYIEAGGEFYYAVFIVDVYTREIVGYSVSDHLRASANVQALKSAVRLHGYPAIHHSDRGSQYVYKEYVNLLEGHKVQISMALAAQENAYAERINLTIKDEYLKYFCPETLAQLRKAVKKAVVHYNTKRPHNSLRRMSPSAFETASLSLPEQNRQAVKIYRESDT